MGCCVCHTKHDDIVGTRRFTNSDQSIFDYKMILKNNSAVKIRKIENFIRTEDNLLKILKQIDITKTELLNVTLMKEITFEKINKHFNSFDIFIDCASDYIFKEYILNEMNFKDYDVISIIENYLTHVDLKAEERERIESLIRLYLLIFKRNKKGFIYNINSDKISLISKINSILLNLVLFNKAEILNIKVCPKSINENIYIEGLKELISGLKNLKALIFQFDDSDKSNFLTSFYQIIHVSKNLVYFILTFSDYTEISDIFIQIILDILSLDKLYAFYISKIKIKHEDFKKLLNLLKSLKKLKTLEEHNGMAWKNQQSFYDLSKPQKNGIGCPKCGEEMWDSNPMITLTSYPAQKNVHCDCGFVGYRYA